MFQKLTAFAITAYSAFASKDAGEVLLDAQCNSVLAGGMYYDITALNRGAGPYSYTVTGAGTTETL